MEQRFTITCAILSMRKGGAPGQMRLSGVAARAHSGTACGLCLQARRRLGVNRARCVLRLAPALTRKLGELFIPVFRKSSRARPMPPRAARGLPSAGCARLRVLGIKPDTRRSHRPMRARYPPADPRPGGDFLRVKLVDCGVGPHPADGCLHVMHQGGKVACRSNGS